MINNIKCEIICNINEKYLIEISGKNNIEDALLNEFLSIKTINILNIDKIENGLYKILVDIDSNILYLTDKNNIKDSVESEFKWLDQSGIILKNIYIIND